MKFSREALIKWGTIIIIVFFAIEFFWVLMYVPSQGNNTASPTPQAAFEGSGYGKAKITSFTGKMIAACNESAANFESELKAVKGVESIFKASQKAFLITLNATAANESVNEINSLVQEKCLGEKTVMREALLEFTDKIVFYASDPKLNQSKTLYPKHLENAFRTGTTGYVYSESIEGEEIQTVILVKMLGENFVDMPLIEEARGFRWN